MELKIKKKNIPVLVACVGLFMFPAVLRSTWISSSFILVNYLTIISLIAVYRYNKHMKASNIIYQNRKLGFYVIETVMYLAFIVVTFQRKDYLSCLLYAVTIMVPTFIINFDFNDVDYFDMSIKIWERALFTVGLVISGCGVIDVVTGYKVSGIFANYYQVTSLITLAESHRIVSYMGHALFTSEILLIYYVTYYLYKVQYLHRKEKLFHFAIALFGIALTGSKTGIVLILGVFILFHANWKSRRIIPVALLALLMMYWLGFFDKVFERFRIGLEMGDLTTNRNTALADLLAGGGIEFHWFSGQNIDYGWQMVAALEYPILRWAYQFGILVSICLTLLMFVYPLCKLIHMKANKAYIIGCVTIMLCVNMYNGLSLKSDYALVYCLSIAFLLNMARIDKFKLTGA